MIFVSLVDPRLLPHPPDSLFWGVQFRYHCDKIVINTFLDLKMSLVIDPTKSVELAVRDVLGILLWPPSYFPCITNNHNTRLPCSNQHPREGKKVIHTHHIITFIPIGG